MSKNSVTIVPPRGSTRFLARVICQAREDSGSWLSSVDTRPQNASSSSASNGLVMGTPFSRVAPIRARPSSRMRSSARAAAGVSAGGWSGTITRTSSCRSARRAAARRRVRPGPGAGL